MKDDCADPATAVSRRLVRTAIVVAVTITAHVLVVDPMLAGSDHHLYARTLMGVTMLG